MSIEASIDGANVTTRWAVHRAHVQRHADGVLCAMLDDPHARQARQRMVERQLAARGISDARVLEAMNVVPREWFVPDRLQHAAYDDSAQPVSEGQTISQPYIVALMTQALRLAPHHRVLEIGTGTGYQTFILSLLAGRIDTIERLAGLSSEAQRRLDALGAGNIRCHVLDGSVGLPAQAPFDRIIVTAGAPRVPPCLVDQLVEGGRMVIPIGEEGDQTLIAVQRSGDHAMREHLTPCRFVRLIGVEGWPRED